MNERKIYRFAHAVAKLAQRHHVTLASTLVIGCDDTADFMHLNVLRTVVDGVERVTVSKNPKIVCEACDGRGFLIQDSNHIERCDLCETFDSDESAVAYVRSAVDRFESLNNTATKSGHGC